MGLVSATTGLLPPALIPRIVVESVVNVLVESVSTPKLLLSVEVASSTTSTLYTSLAENVVLASSVIVCCCEVPVRLS